MAFVESASRSAGERRVSGLAALIAVGALVLLACGEPTPPGRDAGATVDASDVDASDADGGGRDGGETDAGAVDAGAPVTCEGERCSGHGVCREGEGGAVCECDFGFHGARCETRTRDAYDRVRVATDLADPSVLALDDDLFFMSGTRGGHTLPMLRSTDLRSFELSHHYDPSAVDSAHDYCHVWAPDLSQHGGLFHLYFSAQRVAKGAACPATGQDVTTFHATAPTEALVFGAPELLHQGTSFPRSRIASGCPPDGCSRVIRIDSSTFDEGDDRWFFYVWFERGNNISAFRFGDPGRVMHVTGPATAFAPQLTPDEEAINEGPDLFTREGRTYLFFSTGWFDSQYAMHYLMAPSASELTRARAVRRHSRAVRGVGGALVESHGHNTIVERRGELFNVFHQGVFAGGAFVGRDTHVQRLAFREDGAIYTLNLVNVRWGALPGYSYSLDVVLRDGTVVGPCVDVGTIGSDTGVTFSGTCPSAGHRVIEKSQVDRFRVYYSNDGAWSEHAEVVYDGYSDDVFVPLPGAQTTRVALRWNERETGAEYSLDVQRRDGEWIAPCVGAHVIGSGIEHTFTGRCPTAGADVSLADVQGFRICSAVGDDWAHARCGSAPWDGAVTHAELRIPRGEGG